MSCAKRLIVSGPGPGRHVRGHPADSSRLFLRFRTGLIGTDPARRQNWARPRRIAGYFCLAASDSESPGFTTSPGTQRARPERLAVRFEAVRILVLGGTSFVGRAIVEDALRTGAEVTLFGRGKTAPDLFPDLTRLTGDRDTGDYAALGAGSWDAVVDVSGYVPRHVGQVMDALGERAGRYLFTPVMRCTSSTG